MAKIVVVSRAAATVDRDREGGFKLEVSWGTGMALSV
jgi:hypothetical protein